VFWVIFVILAAFIIAGSIVRIIYMDVIFGLLAVGVGAAKLAEEITHRRIERSNSSINETVNYMTKQMEAASVRQMETRT